MNEQEQKLKDSETAIASLQVRFLFSSLLKSSSFYVNFYTTPFQTFYKVVTSEIA